MTSEKGLVIKRLIIFIVIAFVPLCIAVIILNKAMGGLLFAGELASSPTASLVAMLGMLFPAAASIITRLITKEGFCDTYLCTNFKGNIKYYALYYRKHIPIKQKNAYIPLQI